MTKEENFGILPKQAQPIRLLITDDHPALREGLKKMLKDISSGKYKFIIDEADNGKTAVEKFAVGKYDLLLMDFRLPGIDGIQASKLILKKDKSAKIILYSQYSEKQLAMEALLAGIKGFSSKAEISSQLMEAIDKVLNGDRYCVYKDILIATSALGKTNKAGRPIVRGITPIEKAVLQYYSEGLSREEISKKLNISKRTIDGHRNKVIKFLEANNLQHAIKIGTTIGIIQ